MTRKKLIATGRKMKTVIKDCETSFKDEKLKDAVATSKELKYTNDICYIVVLTFLSAFTRLYYIHEPKHVCWDETHFGKMASWYLNRTFFFDVHPPLGKMLISLAGYVSGYDGKFAFEKPGDAYDNYSQYLGMRIFCATLGLSIIPLIYTATKSISKSTNSAILASTLILFDNGMITLTRYILLDPLLLFFVVAAFLGYAKFSFEFGPSSSEDIDRSFSVSWWFWLIWTGAAIAGAVSVKFVGLFCVILVGLRTIYDLWIILGDIKKPISYFAKHLFARALFLIVWPIALYVISFHIHLKILNHSGNGDGFYSSAFQSQLIGNSLHNSSWPIHLAYGATITLKNNRIGGAYLHSHWHLYPEGIGAKQQQVTTYSHKDSNNKWIIKRALDNLEGTNDDIFVHDNDYIRLEHLVTKRNLHSHFEPAPLTKRHNQVTGYGQNGIGDANDIWQVVKDKSKIISDDEDNRIYTVKSRFRLIHVVTKCALHSHSKQLPKWAYEQLEVTCNPKLYDKNNYWNVEDNFYPQLPNVSFENYAPKFLDRFIESHAVMFQGNSGLKPKEGEVTSRPWQWPLNYRGQFFSASNGHKIYLLGNPLIWWANIVCLPMCLIIISIKALSSEYNKKFESNINNQPSFKHEQIDETFTEAATWTFIGWAIHYFPFFFMGRILYFHHYFPAFIFSCVLTGMTLDYLIFKFLQFVNLKRAHKSRNLTIDLIIISAIIYTFCKFLPITYGTSGTIFINDSTKNTTSQDETQHLSSLKWLESWEF